MSLLDTTEGRDELVRLLRHRPEIYESCVRFSRSNHPKYAHHARYLEAIYETSDPAKLAELIASEARRCGIESVVVPQMAGMVRIENNTLVIYPSADNGGTMNVYPPYAIHGRILAMPQARAILLALLQLPDGAREQAERVIRGER